MPGHFRSMRAHEPGHRAEHMLAVVHHQQRLLLSQHLEQGVLERLPTAAGEAEHLRDGAHHPCHVTNRCEFHQPSPVTVVWQHVGGDL